MGRLKNFILKSIIGGFVVLIPLPILYFASMWLFGVVTGIIEPLTYFLLRHISLPKLVADMIALAIILFVCFFVGGFIRTRLGKFIHEELEQNFLKKIPFYGMVKGAFVQLFGEGTFLECPAAIVHFSPEVSAPALVTEDNGNGLCTIFLLTAPNPMSGLEFYVRKENVEILPGKEARDLMLQTIFSCGIGSRAIFELQKQRK